MRIRPQSFDHVFWLGGSPCSGKSSIVDLLAEQVEVNVYHCDDHFRRHVEQADPDEQPHLHQVNSLSWDDLFSRPVDVQVADEIAIYREQFPMIAADLRAFPTDAPLLVEGADLLPEIVANLIPAAHHALFLVPTPAFQRATYAGREWKEEILQQCRDPEQAWTNWMARDAEFGRWITATARHRGLAVLAVDGSHTIAENAERVAEYFRLTPESHTPLVQSLTGLLPEELDAEAEYRKHLLEKHNRDSEQ